MVDVLAQQDSSNESSVPSDELICGECGYNLHGLPLEGKCPECGCDIATGLTILHLRNNDPIWLSRLHVGAQLAVVDFALQGATLLAGIVSERSSWRWDTIYRLYDLVPLLELLCCWILTTPSKTVPENQRSPILRRLIRVGAILTFTLRSFSTIFYELDAHSLTVIIGSATLILLLFYVRHLARFLHNEFVHGQMPLLLAAWTVLTIATISLQRINLRTLDVRVQVYLLALIFVQIYACVMFVSLSRSFRAVAVYARNHWHRFANSAVPASTPFTSSDKPISP